MCCLRYEYETYLQEAKITPAVDSTVKTPDGVGTVVEANALRGLLKVSINDSIKTFKRDDVKVIAPPKAKKPASEAKSNDIDGDLE
jgi:cell fate regulator YaaT (PSP1 superfamily)